MAPSAANAEYGELLRLAGTLEERVTQLNTRSRDADLGPALQFLTNPPRLPNGHGRTSVEALELVLAELHTSRLRLRDIHEALLKLDIFMAVDNSVDERLWKYVFHDHVELCRFHLRKLKSAPAESQALKSRWSAELQSTLDAANIFYHTLIVSTTSRYNLNLARSGLELTVSIDAPFDSQRKVWLVCLHRCLVYMGDVERYKVYHASEALNGKRHVTASGIDPYLKAKEYYYQSIAAYRESAAYSNDDINVLYWYTLSLMLPYPSNNAWVNLQNYVKSYMSRSLKLGHSLNILIESDPFNHIKLYLRLIALVVMNDQRRAEESPVIMRALSSVFIPRNRLRLAADTKFFDDMGKILTVAIGRIWDLSLRLASMQDAQPSRALEDARLDLLVLGMKTANWLLGIYERTGYYSEAALRAAVPQPGTGLAAAAHSKSSALTRLSPLALWLDFFTCHYTIFDDALAVSKVREGTNSALSQEISAFNEALLGYLASCLHYYQDNADSLNTLYASDLAHAAWLPHDHVFLGAEFFHAWHARLPLDTDDAHVAAVANPYGRPALQAANLGLTPPAARQTSTAWLCWLARVVRTLTTIHLSPEQTEYLDDLLGIPNGRDQSDGSDGVAGDSTGASGIPPAPHPSAAGASQDLLSRYPPPPVAVDASGANGNRTYNTETTARGNGTTKPVVGAVPTATYVGGGHISTEILPRVRCEKRTPSDLTDALGNLSLGATGQRHYLIIPDLDAWAYHFTTFRTWTRMAPQATLVVPACTIRHLQQLKRGTAAATSGLDPKLGPRAREVLAFYEDVITHQTALTNLDPRGPKPLNEHEAEFPLTACTRYRLYFMKIDQTLDNWDQAKPFFQPTPASPPPPPGAMVGLTIAAANKPTVVKGEDNGDRTIKDLTGKVVAAATTTAAPQKPAAPRSGDILTHRHIASKHQPILAAVLYILKTKLTLRNAHFSEGTEVLLCTRDPELTFLCTLFGIRCLPVHRITL
ncbi:hypothetical protein IWQ60_001672 [Tieghemiomyces parasiticus]|uniref:Telomerase activating protein Est1-like N-terminal domain-containing protein n=1 Tax=Tieghemiomyces parasiticus TaxID=78921 RepID=A0A9W8AJG4_9FUNG|nr:hypothetical protein IWQ60_001672 [Tieghemiomyces parasiticus]